MSPVCELRLTLWRTPCSASARRSIARTEQPPARERAPTIVRRRARPARSKENFARSECASNQDRAGNPSPLPNASRRGGLGHLAPLRLMPCSASGEKKATASLFFWEEIVLSGRSLCSLERFAESSNHSRQSFYHSGLQQIYTIHKQHTRRSALTVQAELFF